MIGAVRIGVLVPDLQVGGLQAMAVGLAEALDRSRFEPVFYSFDSEGPLSERLAAGGMAHVHLPRGQGVQAGYARQLARRLLSDGIGLVHCHNVTALFHGARAARRAGGLPVIFTEHDREMPAPMRHRLLHRWLARQVGAVTVVSASLAAALVRYEGFPADRTEAVLNGILDPRPAFVGTRAEARAELGWDERPVLLAVGSLTEVKNHVGLLEAVGNHAGLLQRRVRVVIAGEGPLATELERAAQMLPAQTLQLLGRRSDVSRLLAAADVFVLPSHREGLSLSLVEAHAMARASVAYDVGGNGEVIVHDTTGLLAQYPDGVALADALAVLVSDPQLAARYGSAARQRFEQCFTHGRMVAAYTALYERLLSLRAA